MRNGRALYTQMYVKNQVTINGKTVVIPPLKCMNITVSKQTKDDNTFSVIDTEISRNSTLEEMKLCKQWKDIIVSGGAIADESDIAESPTVEKDEHGEVVRSGIYTYGETVHIFVERKNYNGAFLPGFVEWQSDYNPESLGLKYIDHMVGNVGWGEMNQWVKWYEEVMGFENFLSFDDKQIHTEYSALMSKVMSNGNGRIKFPINEPAKGNKRSQIEEYLDFYEGPGVQHIAVATDDILYTVKQLRARGVEFLSAPPRAYYDEIPARLGVHMEMMKEDQLVTFLPKYDDAFFTFWSSFITIINKEKKLYEQ
jgi:4-hydroxyphenylpyruvate dioxygenase